ncbi:MAG: helix-turn-helix transcriptional regulator [Candidatus Methanofastidiosia archaeon]
MSFKDMTENERLFSSVLIIFFTYFGITILFSLSFPEREDTFFMHYTMTISFLIGMIFGITFFILTKPKGSEMTEERGISVVEKILEGDEGKLFEIVRNSEGITQDSLRFRTKFSSSKVSALLLNLEKKNVIQREKTGRTYKIYVSEWLKKV